MDQLEEKEKQANIAKLGAEELYYLARSKTEVPRLFIYGISAAIGLVVSIAGISKLMSGG